MDSLVESYLKSPHEIDRKKAIGALVRTGDREAFIALQQLAEIDESLEIRFYARKALAMVKSMRRTRADDPLLMLIPEKLDVESFQQFSDEEKCSLLQALIGQNRTDTLSCLIELLKIEQNPHVVATLVIAIGTFGTVAECRFLIPCLSHKDARVRANTIEALELIGNLKLFAYIFPLLEDPDNRVRANAARSLKSIEPFTSFRLLQAMLSSGKVAFQASAVFVLRCFESDASANLLVPFLDSPHDVLKTRAEQTLRILAEKGVARAQELVSGLVDSPISTQPEILPEPEPEKVIEEITGHPEPVQEVFFRLKQAFAVDDPRQRLEEIEKESVQLGERAVEPLIEHLHHETDTMVTGKVYILLGRLYDSRALPTLVEGLSHPDNRCRANAVEAIGMLGDPEGLSYLIPFLEDPHNRVRGNAILALRAANDVDIKTPIMSLVEHSEEFYQRTAVYVLSELQRPEYFPILKRLTRAAFPVVRKNAHTAISALVKAGFNVDSEDGSASGGESKAEQPVFTEQIIGMIGGSSSSRIVQSQSKSRAPIVSKSARGAGSSPWKIAGIVLALIVMLAGIAVSIGMYMRFKEAEEMRAAEIAAALTPVKNAIGDGRAFAEKIPPVLGDAEKFLESVEKNSALAVVAQRKLAYMREAVKSARELVDELVQVFANIQSTYQRVLSHCQQQAEIIKKIRSSAADSKYPCTDHVDLEETKNVLATLAESRDHIARALVFVSKLSANVTRISKNLPDVAAISAEQDCFKTLKEVLPGFERPLSALIDYEKKIMQQIASIESAETRLVRANPRHETLGEVNELKDSLYDSRGKLLKLQEQLKAKKQDTEKLVADGDVSLLLVERTASIAGLEVASQTCGVLLEIPEMLEKSLASLVSVMSALHEKGFAEKVKAGMEEDFTTNWDKVVNKERTSMVSLYNAAHPRGGMTVEGLAAMVGSELSDLNDELQAVITLAGRHESQIAEAAELLGELPLAETESH